MYAIRSYYAVIAYQARLWASPEPGGPAQRQGVPEIGKLKAINAIPVDYDVHQAARLLDEAIRQGRVVLTIDRITSYNVCYTKLLRRGLC